MSWEWITQESMPSFADPVNMTRAWFSRLTGERQNMNSPCSRTTGISSRSYILAPVIRRTTLDRLPQIKAPLEKLSAQLDNDTMAALNAAVDLHGRRVEDVASDFLRHLGLLSGST